MEKANRPNVIDIEESSGLRALSRGIKLSKVNETLKGSIDIAVLLGKLQQHGWVKIIYDSELDEEPLVQLTEKGKQRAFALLFSQ
jgi:hypothetical protein